jgi:hypothetical protein
MWVCVAVWMSWSEHVADEFYIKNQNKCVEWKSQ